MTISEVSYKHALGRFATGVCVVTMAGSDGRVAGVTISSFTSVSIDPPLVLFCLGRKNEALIRAARVAQFAINILADNQEDISEGFAWQAPEKLAGIAWRSGETGAPIIDGCLAALECAIETIYEGGDHLIVVGRVLRLEAGRGRPLIRYCGRYARLS